jgi:hypothetical protein
VDRQTGRRPWWRVIAQAIDDEGWRIAALMRFWGRAPNCARPTFNPWLIAVAATVVLTIVFLVSRRIRTIRTAKAVIRPTASAGTPQNATS